jgi:excisionase family DNA binding protein
MTVREASGRIGISASKLYQLVAAHKIAHYRVGGKILFQDDDIAAFLAGCRVTVAPPKTIIHSPRFKLKHIRLNHRS